MAPNETARTPPTPRPRTGDAQLGIVVIGRNEGDRLKRCLASLGPHARTTIYVDSGSQDDSIAHARQIGATVVELDTSMPFTAARARNAGFEALLRLTDENVAMVQFVDGDCEVEPQWLARAMQELDAHPELAVVFGRRRERARDATRYNRLCDLEWDVPIGDVLSCGGDALMRTAAFRACGGYDPQRIAGEEPELCERLRASGWRVRRIDAPMTVHDADMHHFGQWWRRMVRSGYVEAEGLATSGAKYPRRRASFSNLFWAIAVPLGAGILVVWALVAGQPLLAATGATALIAAYGLLWWRVFQHARRRWPSPDAKLYATFCTLGKWPSVHGMATYWWRRLSRQDRRLIEYKGPTPR